MCRMLAYLGPDVSLESVLLSPPFSLLRQSYAPRMQRRGRFNADGFGVGWYDHARRPEPAVYRRATPMWSDPSFASIAGLIHSTAVLAAVRNATEPSPVQETNNAPFMAGPWLFAHNGEITGYATGGRARLLGTVSDGRAAGIAGTADSEVLFAMVLDRLDAGAGPSGALAEVVAFVQNSTGGRLNMVLTDGRSVAATACGDSLFLREGRDGQGVVVASEPFDDEPGWREMPDGTLIEVTAGAPARIGGMSL